MVQQQQMVLLILLAHAPKYIILAGTWVAKFGDDIKWRGRADWLREASIRILKFEIICDHQYRYYAVDC